jgi:hypothetical protein
MAIAIWGSVILLIIGFFYWATNLLEREAREERFDTGLAIIEFGRAYPDEAIRQVAISADGEMIFLRLWTGRCGCMRRNGSRYLCHLIDPTRAHVLPTDDGNGLKIDFPGIKQLSGEFPFRSQKEVAEVSLWVLGSFTNSLDADLRMPTTA